MLTETQIKQFNQIAEEYVTVEEYILYLVANKKAQKLAWNDIAVLVEANFGEAHEESYYRRKYKDVLSACDGEPVSVLDEIREAALQLQKERVKLSDERTQNRAYIRDLARVETLKEIAINAAKTVASQKMLDTSTRCVKVAGKDVNEAILEISDWHYGMEFQNSWNSYNPKIARERISKLTKEVINYCEKNSVERLHVVNLADLIAGRIHLVIRLESRFDVITQIVEVSEILAEMLVTFSKHFAVDYYDCLDNHSRLEPSKNDALDAESLCRITTWYLKERLQDSVNIHDNVFGEDIITFKCKKYNILGVHGDKDRPNSIIDSISRMTHNHYDLICTAHLHHFSADEKNETLIVCNGALMGTDTYAKNLRLSARPSQTLIIVSDKSVAEAIYRILL